MNQAIVPFEFEGKGVRVIERDCEPWFVAKDICDALGIQNTTMAVDRLDDDERAKSDLGRQGEAWIINESGLYSLVLRSDKPEAKRFKKWATSTVFPAIRKTGQYAVPISDADKIAEALILAGKQLARTQERLAIAAPKAEAFDAFLDADSWHTMSATAKTLKVGRNNLFKLLREKRIFTAENLPYNEHIQAHRFKVVQTEYKRGDAKLYADTTFVSCKGVAWLRQVAQEAILDGLIDSL